MTKFSDAVGMMPAAIEIERFLVLALAIFALWNDLVGLDLIDFLHAHFT